MQGSQVRSQAAALGKPLINVEHLKAESEEVYKQNRKRVLQL